MPGAGTVVGLQWPAQACHHVLAPSPPAAPCNPGWDTCDTSSPDCETDLRASTSHCGACGKACGAAEVCVEGACYPTPSSVYGWGSNNEAKLGDGTNNLRVYPAPVSTGQSYVAIAAGGWHGCGLLSTGKLMCWGYNDHGQLGDGTTINRPSPVQGASGHAYAAITAGAYHTCGLMHNGSVECFGECDEMGTCMSCWAQWQPGLEARLMSLCARTNQPSRAGLNERGALGDGTTTDRASPVHAAQDHTFAAIAAGWIHTCGLKHEGSLLCWG